MPLDADVRRPRQPILLPADEERKFRPLTRRERALACDWYRRGFPRTMIAAELGIHPQLVGAAIMLSGRDDASDRRTGRRNSSHRVPAMRLRLAVEAVRSGATLAEAQRRYVPQISLGTLYAAVLAAGYQTSHVQGGHLRTAPR